MTVTTPVEKSLRSQNGYLMAAVGALGLVTMLALIVTRVAASGPGLLLLLLCLGFSVLVFMGLYMLDRKSVV